MKDRILVREKLKRSQEQFYKAFFLQGGIYMGKFIDIISTKYLSFRKVALHNQDVRG